MHPLIRFQTHLHSQLDTYTYAHTLSHAHTRIPHTRLRTLTYAYKHVIHTYICTLTHTCTQSHTRVPIYRLPHSCEHRDLIEITVNDIKVKLTNLFEDDPKAPSSTATTPRCREGHYTILWIAPLEP